MPHTRKERQPAPAVFRLTGLGRATDRRLELFLAGRTDGLWVPRSEIVLRPGHVFIPVWLCRKLNLNLNPEETCKD